jgi:hypothetical protein
MDSLKNGVQNPAVIDLVAHDPSCDEVVLAMYEERAWDGSEDRLFELQEKFNTYLSFALDGEMSESYPQYQGKKIRIQLNCFYSPDTAAFEFLDQVKAALPEGFSFAVCIPDPSQPVGECGSDSCGCKGG